MARQPSPMRRRVMLWLLGYMALMTVAVFSAANYLHERAEHMVWRTLLNTELDSMLAHAAREPDYHWQDSDTLRLYRLDAANAPLALRDLHAGLHDGVDVEGKQGAVMVRDTVQGRLALVLDITDFAALERFNTRLVLVLGVTLLAITLVMGAYGMARLVRPLSDLARNIGALRPERAGQRVVVDPRGSAELYVIADAVNDYLYRNQKFMERERAFIDSASHELRTPAAVIAGATELAMGQNDMAGVRPQLARIYRTVRGVEQLITLLLTLAKDPARLAAISDRIRLDHMLPEIVEDHRHLCEGKGLRVILGRMAACEVVAPEAIVQAAIGNLLRNAIENSDRGEIVLSVTAPCTVSIADPGHGMSPEEISAIYTRMARDAGRDGGGIGLDLIARLCEHLGWKLKLDSGLGRGTIATLDMSASVSASSGASQSHD